MSATRAIFPLAVVFVALAATVAAALHFADYGTDPPNSDEWFAGTNRPADITAPVRKIYPIPSAVAYGREIAAATVLVPAASLDKRLVPECSGLAASQKYPGVFWAHSDSDTAHRFNTLVPIYADGRTVRPPVAASPKNGGPQQAREQWRGIVVAGARNNDWEAITTDGRGNLILGDIGNNTN
ncbi:MAG: hypothetical protein LBT53_09585, partial [Puniceicoccales bacterium]|nr:hypothetical protein [Puniceicoccales bacterium]